MMFTVSVVFNYLCVVAELLFHVTGILFFIHWIRKDRRS